MWLFNNGANVATLGLQWLWYEWHLLIFYIQCITVLVYSMSFVIVYIIVVILGDCLSTDWWMYVKTSFVVTVSVYIKWLKLTGKHILWLIKHFAAVSIVKKTRCDLNNVICYKGMFRSKHVTLQTLTYACYGQRKMVEFIFSGYYTKLHNCELLKHYYYFDTYFIEMCNNSWYGQCKSDVFNHCSRSRQIWMLNITYLLFIFL